MSSALMPVKPVASLRPAVAIVADDLTGACDAALPFVGVRDPVVVGLGRLPRGAAVASVSTETREALPPVAAARSEEQVAAAWASGPQTLIKKVDSRLRGPIGAELSAARAAAGAPFVLLAPAAPRLDRFVQGGIVAAAGEQIPAAARLLETAPLGSAVITIPATADEQRLARHLAASGLRGGFAVCDASRSEHLRAIAATATSLRPQPLIAGAAGLAEALAEMHLGDRLRDRHLVAPAGRVLFLLGSLHPGLRAQLDLLIRSRPVGCVSLSELRSTRSVHRLARHPSLVVESVRSPCRHADDGSTARALSRVAAALLAAEEFDAVLCSGGAVAAALCRQLRIDQIELVGELAPGFALGRTSTPDAPPLFGLRSGGFGKKDSLVAAYDRVMQGLP